MWCNQFSDSSQLDLTALKFTKYSRYATITHPYHPFYGKSFKILSSFIKNRSETQSFLHLENKELKNFYVLLSWTNRADPTLHPTINREDFKFLVADVSMGKVGAIFALEAYRFARSCTDWHRLLQLCAMTNTLIIDEDGYYDLTDFNYQLLLGLKDTMSQAELHFIRARMLGGKLNKAKKGELRFPSRVHEKV